MGIHYIRSEYTKNLSLGNESAFLFHSGHAEMIPKKIAMYFLPHLLQKQVTKVLLACLIPALKYLLIPHY